ncbi:Aldo/keto reductase [Imleria badia]|nr:Aldo/keto reductase [Imleria badia]
MPWDSILLSSGYSIPSIAFGTWKLGNGQDSTDKVIQALDNGFSHIDTVQAYRNEAETGIALRETSLSREDVFITTKYSGTNGLDIGTSIRNSLANWMSGAAVPDIPTAWAEMEIIKKAGLARSIGVSNFDEKDLEILLASAKIKPAVNQILLHPYVYRSQQPILEYAAKHGIVIEAYSALIPITQQPGGPLDAPLSLLLTVACLIRTSSKKTRLQGYLTAGDIKLTQEDIDAIDAAGAIGKKHNFRKLEIGATCSYLNIRDFMIRSLCPSRTYRTIVYCIRVSGGTILAVVAVTECRSAPQQLQLHYIDQRNHGYHASSLNTTSPKLNERV